MKSTQLLALVRKTRTAADLAAMQRTTAVRTTHYWSPMSEAMHATLLRMESQCAGWDEGVPTYCANGLEHAALLEELADYPNTVAISQLRYFLTSLKPS